MDSSKKSPRVSVIIPHWNGIDVLQECLESMLATVYRDLEIIVVDNDSQDGSADWVAQNYPDLTLIRNQDNYGYAGGCNRGAEKASGDYFIFLNNDTVHSPDWVSELVNVMESDPEIGAVQPKILNYYRRDVFDYAGGSGGQLDILCFPFARGRIFLEQEQDRGQYDDIQKIFWASGTAIMVRKSAFIAASGFDESFFAHMEEIDLCWRLIKMGRSIMVAPQAVIYHKNAVSLPMHSYRKNYLNHRNSLYMMFSNYPLKWIGLLGPVRVALEYVALVYALTKLDWKHILAIFTSQIWIITHLHRISEKRKRQRYLEKINDNDIFKHLSGTSIVWKHYVRGIKYFSELN